jgi:hypothetical protein
MFTGRRPVSERERASISACPGGKAVVQLAACVLAVAAALTACTAVSDFDIEQCSTDSDCETLQGPVRHCAAQRCVEGCLNNRQCSELDPRFPICPVPGAQCVELSAEDGECRASSLYTDASMGDWTASDMLLVGAFAPSVKSSTWLTLLLALDEIEQAGGLASPGAASRPLLLVLCDDTPDSVEGALLHLERLGVRAVLANLEQRALAAALALPQTQGHALYLSPGGSELSPADQGAGPLWSLGAPSSTVVEAYPALIRQALQSARASKQDGSGWHVAFLVGPAREDDSLAQAVRASLTLDGKDANALMGEDHLEIFALSDDSAEKRAQQLRELAAYAPDVVVLFTGGAFSTGDREPRAGVLLTLEEAASPTSAWQPRYVLGPRNANEPILRELALSNPGFRARATGLSADLPPDVSITVPLAQRFAAAYPNLGSGFAAEPGAYDAFFYLAYALAAAPRARVSLALSEVEAGLARITDATAEPVLVGPGSAGLDTAIAHLADGVPFDTTGTTGPARFNPEHFRAGPIHAYCWDAAGALANIASYDRASDAMTLQGNILTDPAVGCGAEVLRGAGN